MPFIDLHCDTINEMLDRSQKLRENDLKVSVKKLKEGDVACQFFAMYLELDRYPTPEAAFERISDMHSLFCREMAENEENIVHVRSAAEMDKAIEAGKIAAFLTVEEGGVCGSSIERLHELYQMGVRLITLTWNFENSIGYPNSDNRQIMNSGLKPFGLEFVDEMQRLGMLIDVSHLSDGGFWDVAHRAKKPFVASHSNARALCPHRRNLIDEQLKAIAEKGGIVGINFYPAFLGEDKIGRVEQIIEHIRHIKRVAGIETLALGSDFDGFFAPCEIDSSADLPKLIPALEQAGFTGGEIEKICFENALRVIREIL